MVKTCRCGSENLKIYDLETKTWHCLNCGSQLGRCQTCENYALCQFADISIHPELPQQKMMTKTLDNGMILQSSVINQERINAVCVNCVCYVDEQCIKRSWGGCDKWHQ